jgi:hypothetical protein
MTPPPGYLPAANFRAAAFPSAEEGWVAGTTGSGCSAARAHDTGGIIEATADGGARGSVQYRGSDAVLSLAFAGTSDGWALAVPTAEVPACSRPLPA